MNSRAPRHIWAGTREKLHTQECELGLRIRSRAQRLAGGVLSTGSACEDVDPASAGVGFESGNAKDFEAGENLIRAALTAIVFGEPEGDRG